MRQIGAGTSRKRPRSRHLAANEIALVVESNDILTPRSDGAAANAVPFDSQRLAALGSAGLSVWTPTRCALPSRSALQCPNCSLPAGFSPRSCACHRLTREQQL